MADSPQPAGPKARTAVTPDQSLMPPAKWGRPDVVYTPAYWQAVAAEEAAEFENQTPHRLGSTFREECAACLLGGHGIPAEIGIAAFDTLKFSGLLAQNAPSFEDLLAVLGSTIDLPDGRSVKYRFARQKSRYLEVLLGSSLTPPTGSHHRSIRDWLTRFPGFGPKTASWVVRNWFDSDQVAIIDIHIQRAGLLAGIFEPTNRLPKDYLLMERRLLAFAALIGVRPSALDAIVWRHFKRAGKFVLSCLERSQAAHQE